MVFNSLFFLIFFSLFFVLYWTICRKASIHFRNGFILVSSYVFYGWWDYRFLALIALSSIIDFILGLSMEKSTEKKRKLLLGISFFANLGILGFFKYFNFFVKSFVELFSFFSIELQTSTLSIILPVGISFYTFQTMSYTIDIYRKEIAPTRNVLSFFAFVSFFPQLVAGPIERAKHLLPQFSEKKHFSYPLAVAGMRLVLWGFFKKIVLADNFGALADSLFNTTESLSGASVWAGAVFFAIQIYCDFSGYSDIAIGISRMLGFDLMTNFRTPYFAKTFSEFWRRWHISLSTWFRDYVYIPLGGNKGSRWRVSFSILITFLLSGLWHGANITFIIWGALHGIMLIFERNGLKRIPSRIYSPFVLLLVLLFWLPFRAENAFLLAEYFDALVHFGDYTWQQLFQIIALFSTKRFILLLLILIGFIVLESRLKHLDFSEWIGTKTKKQRLLMYYSLLIGILLIGNFSVKPSFIYFQF